MYIDSIELTNFRTFRKSKVDFCNPDQDYDQLKLPRPRLPNINLLLGNNGLGKTTLLKAVALSALGPAVRDSGIPSHRLIRREPGEDAAQTASKGARIKAVFHSHRQDDYEGRLEADIRISRKGDLEILEWAHRQDKTWHPIFSASSDAFFFVGYGATRRVEKIEIAQSSRLTGSFARAQRIKSLFEEAYSLLPLNFWLPHFKQDNPGRYKQVVNLINSLTGLEHYQFTGEMEQGEYVFEKAALKVPFPALSDGYRAFLGWIGDLLYHVCMTAPSGRKLQENRGIVMVDEIDLHLHPKWQLTILETLAKELPNIQFIVTSHSPLLVGTLEWMNIIVMRPGPGQSSQAERLEWPVHGLDADQVLLTDFFGLESTRAPSKKRTLKELSLKARDGDTEAAKQLLMQMSQGAEAGA